MEKRKKYIQVVTRGLGKASAWAEVGLGVNVLCRFSFHETPDEIYGCRSFEIFWAGMTADKHSKILSLLLSKGDQFFYPIRGPKNLFL